MRTGFSLSGSFGTVRPEKKSTKINVLGLETTGWWSNTSCPPSKVCFPRVSRERIWDVPGILPGCPEPLGVFKKFVPKKCVRIFRSLYRSLSSPPGPKSQKTLTKRKFCGASGPLYLTPFEGTQFSFFGPQKSHQDRGNLNRALLIGF